MFFLLFDRSSSTLRTIGDFSTTNRAHCSGMQIAYRGYVKYNVLPMTGTAKAEPYSSELTADRNDRGNDGPNGASERPRYGWLPYAIITALLVAIYYHIAAKLVYDWYTIPD